MIRSLLLAESPRILSLLVKFVHKLEKAYSEPRHEIRRTDDFQSKLSHHITEI